MPKILVVEDEAAIARVLVDNLLFEGHEAEAVADGAEGLERALAWQPDLILLDIVLPTMDGYESVPSSAGAGSGHTHHHAHGARAKKSIKSSA